MLDQEEDKGGAVTTEDVYDILYRGMSRKTLTYKNKKFERAFYIKDSIENLLKSNIASSEEIAKDYIDEMIESNYICLLNDGLDPTDDERIGRFKKDNPDHGHQPDKNKTWSMVLKQAESNQYISLKGVTDFHEKCPFVTSMYLDQYNCKLYDAVRPVEWVDPMPGDPYDLVVVGAGSGGISAAIFGAQENFKVALIERSYLGGEYYNTGMVPFNALEHCADSIQKIFDSKTLGLEMPKEANSVNLKKIMEQVRLKRSVIVPQFCNITSFTENYGMDVFLGNAKFIAPQRIMVNDRYLDFNKAIICTGSSPSIPKLDGLSNVPYYTIENIFNMTKKPNTMVIYGWGNMACAFAQVFQRMKIEVTLLSEEKKLIDSDITEGLNKYTEQGLKDLGVKILTGASVSKIEPKKVENKSPRQPHECTIYADVKGVKFQISCQALLIATPKLVFF